MNHSQLRQIIKEEISKALSENVMKYEKLPGYFELPELTKDIDRKSILLPSLYDSNGSSRLFTKKDVKDWIDEFKKKYKENPQFKVEDTKIKVLNLKEPDWDAMKDFGGLD